MNEDSTAMGTAFTQWQQPTDDYAAGLQSLQRGKSRTASTLREMFGRLRVLRRDTLRP